MAPRSHSGRRRAGNWLRQRFLALTQASLAVNGGPVEPELAPNDAPWWTWVFVLGIAGIFVASRGGALWGALIGAGAVSCVGVVRMRRPAAVRALLCAAITAGCWGAFYAIRALAS